MEVEVELYPYGTDSAPVQPGTQSAEEQLYHQVIAHHKITRLNIHTFPAKKRNSIFDCVFSWQ